MLNPLGVGLPMSAEPGLEIVVHMRWHDDIVFFSCLRWGLLFQLGRAQGDSASGVPGPQLVPPLWLINAHAASSSFPFFVMMDRG